MERRIIFVGETDSTNSYLRRLKSEEDEGMVVAVADYQTAGRGQGTNAWESECGKNLLFSILVHPSEVPARCQFVLSMAEALAQKAALETYTDDITLKWPNDVYWKDMKISGTLIEVSLKGDSIRDCIIGTGLNVNQRRFASGAPNPVSLLQVLGHEVDVNEVLDKILTSFSYYMEKVCKGRFDEIREEYCRSLYRRNGYYEYEDNEGRFVAEIVTVEDDGRLVLRRKDGRVSKYAFKEVRIRLNDKY